MDSVALLDDLLHFADGVFARPAVPREIDRLSHGLLALIDAAEAKQPGATLAELRGAIVTLRAGLGYPE